MACFSFELQSSLAAANSYSPKIFGYDTSGENGMTRKFKSGRKGQMNNLKYRTACWQNGKDNK